MVTDAADTDAEGGKVFQVLQEGKLQRYQWDRDGFRATPSPK
jgi:hypothetical protein